MIGIFHFIFVFFDPSPTCNLGKMFIVIGLGIASLFYFLFKQFYNQAYVKNKAGRNKKVSTLLFSITHTRLK